MRTSRFTIFIRATVIVFVIYMMMAWAWNSITNTNFWKPWEMAISAVLTVLMFGGFAWAVTNFGMALMFGRSQKYHDYQMSEFNEQEAILSDSLARHEKTTGQIESLVGRSTDLLSIISSDWLRMERSARQLALSALFGGFRLEGRTLIECRLSSARRSTSSTR